MNCWLFIEFFHQSCTGNPRAPIPQLLALFRIVGNEIRDTEQDHVPIYSSMEEGSLIGRVTLYWEFVHNLFKKRTCRVFGDYFFMLCVEWKKYLFGARMWRMLCLKVPPPLPHSENKILQRWMKYFSHLFCRIWKEGLSNRSSWEVIGFHLEIRDQFDCSTCWWWLYRTMQNKGIAADLKQPRSSVPRRMRGQWSNN